MYVYIQQLQNKHRIDLSNNTCLRKTYLLLYNIIVDYFLS